MKKTSKIRLDILLVERGLVESEAKARALILSGKVLVNESVNDKVGTPTKVDANIRIKSSSQYVGRGGIKMAKALSEFKIDVTDKICLDVGASTGGFTDCLLQNGAKKVFAVDVGYGQMHWKLQSDLRVERIDRTNFRHLDLSLLNKTIDVVVMDVSFISVKLLIPKVLELFEMQFSAAKHSLSKRTLIVLVKPQFEVSKEKIGKGGIVKNESDRLSVLEDIKSFISFLNFTDLKSTPSPIEGSDGNVEFLLGCVFNPKSGLSLPQHGT